MASPVGGLGRWLDYLAYYPVEPDCAVGEIVQPKAGSGLGLPPEFLTME